MTINRVSVDSAGDRAIGISWIPFLYHMRSLGLDITGADITTDSTFMKHTKI
ncbi:MULTISPECIES: hypothetical protein [unclassified Microcoleus]|uniref:hypothetical protein n=1 Tax=unclassified Microcoleus TaxID=2642155 RepID=UPI002FD1F949